MGWNDSLGDEEVDSDDDGPHWLRPIPPWEVSKPYPRPGGPHSVGTIRRPRIKTKRSALTPQHAKDHATASQGLSPTGGRFTIYAAATPPSSPTTSPPSSGGESDATDSGEEEGGGEEARRRGKVANEETFEVDGLLGVELLPRRLPRALVRPSAKGREMAQMRHKIHTAFNEIAGWVLSIFLCYWCSHFMLTILVDLP